MKRYFSAIIFAGLAIALQPTTVRAQTGNSQGSPIFPNSTTATSSTFLAAPTNKWFEASVVAPTTGFRYDMITGGSLFTSINDFPTGFSSPFTVKVGITTIGNFLPGQSVDFVALLGGGVTSFSVSGINPATTTFPVRVSSAGPALANFTATSISATAAPEPGTLALIGLGLSMGAGRFYKRRNSR
jgi:hypothetical protein